MICHAVQLTRFVCDLSYSRLERFKRTRGTRATWSCSSCLHMSTRSSADLSVLCMDSTMMNGEQRRARSTALSCSVLPIHHRDQSISRHVMSGRRSAAHVMSAAVQSPILHVLVRLWKRFGFVIGITGPMDPRACWESLRTRNYYDYVFV